MGYFEEISENEEEILNQGYQGWRFSTTLFTKKIYTTPAPDVEKVPLRPDRNIPELIAGIKKQLQTFVKNASKNIDANWLDLNNDLIRKELVWDINGYLDTLRSQGYFEDFGVICDNRNNPPDVFETGGLRAEVMITLDQEHKTVFYDLIAKKDE